MGKLLLFLKKKFKWDRCLSKTLITKKIKGDMAEKIAADFLKKQGLRLLQSQFRTRLGEIDLIMQDDVTLVFVEVRFRSNTTYRSPEESIDGRKQKRIIHVAYAYLSRKKLSEDTTPCRFDVLALSGSLNKPSITWIKDAFD